MKGTRSSDGHSPLSTPVFLNADRLQMIINSMKHGLSLGIPHFDIDPMNPELLGYLIIDAGEESQHYRNLVAMLLEENDLLREDPHIQTLADTRWAVATLDSDPPQEVWWGIHQQRLVVASGQRSVEIYLEMCEGQRSSLADSRTYKEGLQRCIGSSRISASFQFDLPAIFDQVFGLMDEFGAEIPPETEEVIDQITRTWDRQVVDRRDRLARWLPVMKQFRESAVEVFGFFNNHYAGHAPATVEDFRSLWSGPEGHSSSSSK
jgi:hypothetical protein